MKSVLQKDRECWCCGTIYNLEKHHVIFNTANRKISDKYGYWVYLCNEHHHNGVHEHPKGQLNKELHFLAQEHFLKHYGNEDKFRKTFGKLWIEEDFD